MFVLTFSATTELPIKSCYAIELIRPSPEYDETACPKSYRLRGRRAAIVLFSHYPADSRPRRAAEALGAQGANIDLICLRDGDGEPAHETYGNINVRRVRLK